MTMFCGTITRISVLSILAFIGSSACFVGYLAFAEQRPAEDVQADIRIDQQRREYDRLTQAHAMDVRDPAWSSRKSAEIASRMAALGFGPNTRIDCRHSYCLVDGRWPESGRESAAERLIEVWVKNEPCEFHVPDMSLIDPATPQRLVVIVRCER
jgi:hypothetical protein